VLDHPGENRQSRVIEPGAVEFRDKIGQRLRL